MSKSRAQKWSSASSPHPYDQITVVVLEEDDTLDDSGEASKSVPKRARNATSDQRMTRLAREAAAKRDKVANETPKQRQARLEQKREINIKYFANESEERRAIRLRKKSERERRIRLDLQLQAMHPDLLEQAGVAVVIHDSGTVELRVPWAVPPDETDEQREARYDHQEEVIRWMLDQETPEMTRYRKEQQMRYRKPRNPQPREETEEQRLKRLERARVWVRNRRQNETPDQRVERLQQQRLRTQRNRERKSNGSSSAVLKAMDNRRRPRLEKEEELMILDEEVVVIEQEEEEEYSIDEVVEEVIEEIPLEEYEEIKVEYL